MNRKTLLFISTHIINKAIINEYQKLSRIKNCDTILAIDNTTLKLPVSQNSTVTKQNFYETDIKCFLFDQKVNESLGLPMLTAHTNKPEFKDVMWANADYRFIYVRKYFPNYDFYWQFDYDVYCNGNSYNSFLNKYQKNNDDLIICNFRPESHNSEWCWTHGVEWIYKNQPLYGSFFPVCRLSGKAIDFLYKKRMLHLDTYKEKYSEENKWPSCELFVPTELMNNGFSCSSINDPTIHLNCYNFNNERFFEKPDNKLYHPVKSNTDDTVKINHPNDSNKKYNIFQKIFSVSNIYINGQKYKLIYLMFIRIKIHL